MIDIFLLPGEHFVGDARYRIRTLLGSCVSITLWQPRRRIGAMSHFMLAERARADDELNGRYGEDSMALMLAALKEEGVGPTECQAKIFGGGAMFPTIEAGAGAGVGRRNGESAARLLRLHRIPVLATSLFGTGHRHIIFNVRTGDVWVRLGDAPPAHAASSGERP
jgi:chemotaxis protein CheD